MKQSILIAFLFFSQQSHAQFADTALVKQHLLHIIGKTGYRNHANLTALNNTADYIFSTFKKYADTVYIQEFTVNKKVYKNIICSFGKAKTKRIIVGAHYDVCEQQQGADDNASGVAGLLELARLLQNKKLNNRIDLVAYSLEEPPYFRTKSMGSYVHAKSLKNEKANVLGMISLEMIGYFSDASNSQTYPEGIGEPFGNKGDFIALVTKEKPTHFEADFTDRFQASKAIKTAPFAAPTSLEGIDFSDHLNYWLFHFAAIMITDTSFLRNPNYHKSTDTLATLDLARLAKVIDGVAYALAGM